MTLLTREDVLDLSSPHAHPCVSIYLPTHRHHPGTEQDRVRFKNLLRRAEELIGDGRKRSEVQDLLRPLEELSQPSFWTHQKDGLTIFRSPDTMVHYRLPMEMPELAVVSDSFHIKPLFPFLQTNHRYFVLSLAQNSVALFEGTPEALAPVDVEDLPESLVETLGLPRQAGFLNFRTLRGAAMFHGHGAPDETRKEDLLRFFREIDRAIWRILRGETVPLVLAGVGYYLPLYREISQYRGLLEQAVEGSFDGASPEDLHARVWPVVRAFFDSVIEDALATREHAAGRGLVSDDLAAIARMAIQGRVRRLLLADAAYVWGTLDLASGEIHAREGQQDSSDDDVLDDLAEQVLLRAGEVLLTPAGRLGAGVVASAILRW
jgi:hypothetical protein